LLIVFYEFFQVGAKVENLNSFAHTDK